MSCFDMWRFCPHCGGEWSNKTLEGKTLKEQLATGRIVCGLCGCSWTNDQSSLATSQDECRRLRDIISRLECGENCIMPDFTGFCRQCREGSLSTPPVKQEKPKPCDDECDICEYGRVETLEFDTKLTVCDKPKPEPTPEGGG